MSIPCDYIIFISIIVIVIFLLDRKKSTDIDIDTHFYEDDDFLDFN